MEFLKTQLAGKQKELAEYESRLRLSSHESDIAIADLRIFVISLLFCSTFFSSYVLLLYNLKKL